MIHRLWEIIRKSNKTYVQLSYTMDVPNGRVVLTQSEARNCLELLRLECEILLCRTIVHTFYLIFL
jgi:hypothetical protein